MRPSNKKLPELQQNRMGTMWSKNGRLIKKQIQKNVIESGSVILVDKIAEKMLNQRNISNLENLLRPTEIVPVPRS